MGRYDQNDKDFLCFIVEELERNSNGIVSLRVTRELFEGISEVYIYCKDKECAMPATNDCIKKVNTILYEMSTEYNFAEGLQKIKSLIN